MSRDAVEIVRRSLEAFARGDFDTAFAAHDPATEWRTAADEPDQRTYCGIAELRAFAAGLDELWDDRFADIMEFEDFIERDDWVVVPWSARMRGRGSGITVDVRETYALKVRDGRIVRVEEYRHVDEALARLEQPNRTEEGHMAEFPAPTEGILLTHFIVSDDVERSRRFYTDVLGGETIMAGEPSFVALANSWIIINVGGGPTEDKPTVTLETPPEPDRTSSFLNIRVADIQAIYADWSARGAEFLTPPQDRGAEIRCYVRDPDGHLIEVGQTSPAFLEQSD